MAEFKVGDTVKITEKFNGNRAYVGRVGVITENRYFGYDQVIALGGDETNPLMVDEVEIAHISDDSDLRDAITALPGLGDASLVWHEGKDPVDFLHEYGAALDDLLTYYRKRESKLDLLTAALEVLRDV